MLARAYQQSSCSEERRPRQNTFSCENAELRARGSASPGFTWSPAKYTGHCKCFAILATAETFLASSHNRPAARRNGSLVVFGALSIRRPFGMTAQLSTGP